MSSPSQPERSPQRAPTAGVQWSADGHCRFRWWAPAVQRLQVELAGPPQQTITLDRDEMGVHTGEAEGIAPGARYRLRLDGGPTIPDPASRWQPDGVDGPSAIWDPRFAWDATPPARPLRDLVIYELHVGTFTPDGTLDAATQQLDRLVELGVTAVELMPVAQFPGTRNWGYDGVFPFAVQHSYGGPEALARFVEACHARELSVVLDVVYNHLGPEGAYLDRLGPYFADVYRTPWGRAMNFDGAGSDEVRRFFLANALQWLDDFHIDALRLDAVDAMFDRTPYPFLAELADHVNELCARLEQPRYLIAESDANDPRLIFPRRRGGLGMSAVWCDDFHHAVHALLTGERVGYYADFGDTKKVLSAVRDGFSFTGQYSRYRGRRHGAPAPGLPPESFVVCVQNHDQIGNRPDGQRLGALVSFEARKLAAALVCLSPHVPLLFMGEERGETRPFFYFTEHTQKAAIELATRGRAEDLAAMGWDETPPDPQQVDTWQRCVLDPQQPLQGQQAQLLALYRRLLQLRKRPDFRGEGQPPRCELMSERSVLFVSPSDTLAFAFNLTAEEAATSLPVAAGRWRVLADAGDPAFGGSGPSVPGTLESTGGLTLSLPPHGFLVLAPSQAASTGSPPEPEPEPE